MAEAAGGVPPLPEDLIIWEILTRLPAKPVLRCRAVCRSWRHRLTSDAKFLLAHRSRQPSLPLVTTGEAQDRRIDAMDHRTGERLPVAQTVSTEDLDVLASCDGLLVLIAYGGLYICNPTTRQVAPLPLSHVNCIAGLYPHRPSGSYRVLCCVKTDGHAVYHVHTVGSGELRRIGEPLEPWATGDVVKMMPMMEFLQPHVLAGGRLYWHPLKLPVGGTGKVNNMLVFDTMSESFRHVISPVDGPFIELFEMNDTLGLYDYSGSTADLWVLQDHERWVWLLKRRIKSPATAFSLVPDTNGDIIALSPKGESETGLRWQYLQHISGIDGSSPRRYEWNVFLKLKKLRFKESLVRHPFFSIEGDNNDGGVDEKPLFDGMSTVAVLVDDNYEPH